MKAKILVDTFAKQSTASAKSLTADQIYTLKKGEEYDILKHSPTIAGHRRVTFAKPLGGFQDWLVFDDHVECEGEKPLKIDLNKLKYYSQRDNRDDWWRQCNSSTHAMLLNYLKPDSVASDDEYYQDYVAPFGNTTDWTIHTKALKKFGIESVFRTDLDFDDLDRSLELGFPVPIGVYHKGTINNIDLHSGHVLLIVGKQEDTYIAYDPWGNGFSYEDHNGKGVEYPASPSLERRWLTDGERTGWGRLITSIDGQPTGL